MAAHSSVLAWRILWTEEPGELQSTGPHRVRHAWSNLATNMLQGDSTLGQREGLMIVEVPVAREVWIACPFQLPC